MCSLRTAQALYHAVVARYSSPATAALGRLLLPYLFPELFAFAIVEDLVSHLRTSDARYRAAAPAEFLDRNQPPMFITLYFIVTRLPDSLRSVMDHFLSLDPTALTVDLLEQHLLATKTRVVAIGAARGTPRKPFFEGCSPSLLAPSYASPAAAGVLGCYGSGGGSGGFGGGGGGSGGSSGGLAGATHCGGSGGGERKRQQRRSETLSPQQLREWSSQRGASGGSGSSPYVIRTGIAAAALGASASSGTLPGTAPAEALHTLALESGASRCFFHDSTSLNPLPGPVPVRLADPSRGPVVARSSTVLLCPTGRHQATFTRRPGSSLYTLATEPPQTLLWHHRLGHPSLPRLCGMHSRLLVSGLLRGGEFSSDLLRDFCRGEGVLQLFTLPASPQQNGIAERRIGLVMEVAHTSMIHAAALHFLWPFTVRVPDLGLSCLCMRYVRGQALRPHYPMRVFLGFPPDAPGWQFYHPTLRHVFPSQDVTFDESVPFYRLFPYRSAPPLPPPHFLSPGPPPVDPLPPQGPAPSGVSQVDPLPGIVPVEVAGDSSAARGAASGGAASGGAEPGGAAPGGAECEGAGSGGAEHGGAEPGGAESGGAETGGAEIAGVELGVAELEGVERGGAESKGAESGGAEPRGTASTRGPAGASPRLSPRPEPLSPQQLCEWFAQRTRLRSGAARAGDPVAGDTRAGCAGVTAGAGGTGGAAAAGPGGARTRVTGAAGSGGVGGAGDPMEPGAAGGGGTGAGGAGAGGAGAGGAGVGGTGAVGAGDEGAGAVDLGDGGAVGPRPYFVPLLQQVLGVLSSNGLTPPLLCPLPDQSKPPLQPASPLPAPSPYSKQTGGLTERREPASRPASPVRTGHRVPPPRPPPVPGTHAMAFRPSSVPLHVPLPTPPESSLPAVLDPESDCARVAGPTVSRLLATDVTNPSYECTTASALVAELLDFAAVSRLHYATALVAESESASPPSIGGECAHGTDVLEDKQEDCECLAAAVPCFDSMLLAPEGDPDAPDILTPRSYAEAITGPYSSQWQVAMDAEMASWKSTGTYVNGVPPSRANIVDGMWIFRVKRPLGSPPAFKARYIARGFSQR
ncbi:unnamed protein product [Closterium sp. NIES-53]